MYRICNQLPASQSRTMDAHTNKMKFFVTLTAVVGLCGDAAAFYLPGVAPRAYVKVLSSADVFKLTRSLAPSQPPPVLTSPSPRALVTFTNNTFFRVQVVVFIPHRSHSLC